MMRTSLCVLLAAVCVLAEDSENRRSKLPYVADAVGNTLPPPSNLPATVGSPVNLLTPDRYEFYTFDDSGELVKRLMTLEEIQAIVAAGEETEGLVTFANENQPTVAFNFSQPPTKVHNVVTNVQNVLKAQMEAHKNKPYTKPTLDTPDVSDSWSLILPSIFGNTGVDIVPDKTSGTFTTPETETFDLDLPVNNDDNSLSKEGSNQIFGSSSTNLEEKSKDIEDTEKLTSTTETVKAAPTSTTTTSHKSPTTITTTIKPITSTTTTIKPLPTTTAGKPTTTTGKPTTTTDKPTTTTKRATTSKLTTTTSTTIRPRITTTITTTSTTTNQPQTTSTTVKPRITTVKPTTTLQPIVKTTPKMTTTTPYLSTRKVVTLTQKEKEENFTRIQIQTISNTTSTTEKSIIQYEKISTFIPISTAAYVTERTTEKPLQTTKSTALFASTTKRSVATTTRSLPASTTKKQPLITTYKPVISTSAYVFTTPGDEEIEKTNATTVTTQSVSPSTTASSTEFISIGDHHSYLTENKYTVNENNKDIKENDEQIPLFDVAQSISQIASDLGNYQPIPTTSDLLDTTKLNDINLESKENVEIDIPDDEKDTKMKTSNVTENKTDSFVKISTIDPQGQNKNQVLDKETSKDDILVTLATVQKTEATTDIPKSTTIDPVLFESMEDLLSQVVNQAPQTIVVSEKSSNNENQFTTTEKSAETTKYETSTILTTIEPYERTANETVLKFKENLSESKNISNLISNSTFSTQTTTESKPLKPLDNDHIILKESDIKTENNQNFVQISVSSDKNTSKMEAVTLKTTPKPEIDQNKSKLEVVSTKNTDDGTSLKENKDKGSISNLTNKDDNVKITQTTESLQKLGLNDTSNPLNKFDNSLSQSKPNKIASVVENHKLSNKEDKFKATESLPKIDEFKKKIQKVNIDDKELANERNNSWKLISTVSPPKANEIPKDKLKADNQPNPDDEDIVLDFSKENQGLEVTTKDLGEDIAQFTELCNELAFRYWNAIIQNIDKKRSFVLSPYSITSMLAMMFMGAKGATSGEMNEILKLDDMVTFNPHFTLKNISDSIETSPESGVMVSAFIRELFSDKNKGRILTFYKERAQHFYNGHVEEINFKIVSDIIRRRTNLLVKRYTWGRIPEYMKANTITMQPPLAAFSTNIFQTDCSGSSVDGRDGEMYFVVSPNVRQRRLVPVPAVVYRSNFLAGYDPVLDATAASLGNTNSIISTLFLMPGQQGNVVHAEDLEALEKRLLDSNPTTPAWNRLLRTLLPRMGLELQIPRFSHKSIFNISSTLKMMGLKDLFDADHADLGGLNGPSKDLYLSDMIQSTMFVTCGEGAIGEQHHIEEYPESLGGPQRRRTSRWATGWDEPRDYQRAFHDPHDVGEAMHLPLHLRPRQARLPARDAQPARLKFDRPFLFFVRHNPSGMILYVGRYNPRLLP